MDFLQMEQRTEERRAEMRQAVAGLRLEREALRAKPTQPGRFARYMVGLGTWMMATGERLRKRYEYVPAHQPTMSCKATS